MIALAAVGCADSGTGGDGSFGLGGVSAPPLSMGGQASPNQGGAGKTSGPDAPPTNTPQAGRGMDPPAMSAGRSGTSGMGASGGGAAGRGAAGMMATAGTSGGAGTTAPPPSSGTPIIPELTAECPQFRNGTISFMGLSGIAVQAGAKASGPTAPMVFYWHGTGSFSGEYASMAGAVHRGVIEEGGVLISFQGTTGGDLLSGTAIFGAGDFNLADQLVACAVKNHNVDPRRIFATGCSAGGLFSGAMAAARSNYIAAAAPNSGGWTAPVRWQNDWTPALMTVHGAAGVDVVIVDFSNTSKTADNAFKMRGGFVINCDHGGFHCGGGGLAPDIWNFFKNHPYGTKPSPWAGGLPSGFNSDCKIF